MSFFKLILYFAPFFKEVFIQSNEDRRIWLGRMIIIALIVGAAFYVTVTTMHQYSKGLETQLTIKSTEILTLTDKVSTLSSKLETMMSNHAIDENTIRQLTREKSDLAYQNGKLKDELKQLQIELDGLKHNLDTPPDSQVSKKPVNRQTYNLDELEER